MLHKTRQLAKSVKLGINNPSPQMPSIVPCLDKASKSGWKMQAPFLSVWNYYPFVLSQALLSSPFLCVRVCARVCVYIQSRDSSAEVAEPKSTSQRGRCTHLMFDLATKLITTTPTELLRTWRGREQQTDTTHQLVAAWHTNTCSSCVITSVFFLDLDRGKRLQLAPLQMASSLAHLNASRPLSLFLPRCNSGCTPTRPLSLSFLPFCVFFFVPKLQSNSFLRAVLLEFNPPSLPFQPLFHCENLGSDRDPF